jgi:septum formation protein
MIGDSATMHALSPQREQPEESRFVLASASPRRAELLARAGQAFDVVASGAQEVPRANESPYEFASRVAREKACAVALRAPGRPVLAADTIVVVDDTIFGKPSDPREAAAMLSRLSGRAHEVATAFMLLAPRGRELAAQCVVTSVVFRTLSRDEIDSYVATTEPLDKAGAYAIQGGANGFVRSIRGSLTNVIGLPMEEVERALRAARLWREARVSA